MKYYTNPVALFQRVLRSSLSSATLHSRVLSFPLISSPLRSYVPSELTLHGNQWGINIRLQSNQERGEAQRTMVMMMAMGSVAVVGSHKVDFA